MLLALYLRAAQAVLDCQRAGLEEQRHHQLGVQTFAMTGWRIGYTLAPADLVQALTKLQSQSTSNPTSIAQYAALEAMRGSMESVPAMLAEYDRRRKRIVEGLNAIAGVKCELPGGAFYAFPNVSAHLANGS